MNVVLTLTAPLRWRTPHAVARLLMAFARAERSSHCDMLAAASASPDAARRAAYLGHASDEARHALMFTLRAAELAPTVAADPNEQRADFEHLFWRLGEARFIAFVHLGERRGRARLGAFARELERRGDRKSRALLDAILEDEARHEAYTLDILTALCGARTRRELRRAARWELGRAWLRAGSAVGVTLFSALMFVIYLAAAPLVVDGTIVAAAQEERFSRVKNDASLPRQAIAACLAMGGVDVPDGIVFYEDPYAKLERILLSALTRFPRALRQFPRAMASQLGDKVWVLDALAALTGVDRERVGFCEHHEAHAASAFYCSPFARAAVLTVDAVGEDASTTIWLGEGNTLTRKDRIAFPHSLGLLYAALTAYLGFEVNEGEYKVMGLAAFGSDRFAAEMHQLIAIQRDGTFTLALDYFDAHTDTELGFGKKLEALLGPRRPLHTPWALDSDRDRRYADIAASLQAVTEEALLALARRAKALTGADTLCLAGGVALNAVANARLARESGFSDVFVQPAAGDAGGALGAALIGALRAGDPRCAPMISAALGPPIDAGEAFTLAEALGLDVTRVSDPAEVAATLLADGAIVAWLQGRLEWGPRALGQRSLCALTAPASVRERINRVIKRREPFRPFAPAVRADRASDYFEPFAERLAPFMVTVAKVKPERQTRLAAVTHVDVTARIQTVSGDTEFSALLSALERRTGEPLVLNTSLNGKGEPIVARAADAISFLLQHPIDAMVIGDVCVKRR